MKRKRKSLNARAGDWPETPAEKRASDIQDRIFYVLLALAVIEGVRLAVVEELPVIVGKWVWLAWGWVV